MSPVQRRRLVVCFSILSGCGLALSLILYALSKNIDLFYTPSQLGTQHLLPDQSIRIGGMVVKDSVVRRDDLMVDFIITDFNQQIKVHYQGILPDLFREGQGVVALGKLDQNGQFNAKQVLAKHDEKYMPPEVASGLKAAATLGKAPAS